MTPIFSRIWLMKMAQVLDLRKERRQLAQGLAHQAGLQAYVGIPHFPLEFGPGRQGGHRIHDKDVNGAGTDKGIGNLRASSAESGWEIKSSSTLTPSFLA